MTGPPWVPWIVIRLGVIAVTMPEILKNGSVFLGLVFDSDVAENNTRLNATPITALQAEARYLALFGNGLPVADNVIIGLDGLLSG